MSNIWDIIELLVSNCDRRTWYSLNGKSHRICDLQLGSYYEIYTILCKYPDTIYCGNCGLYLIIADELVIIDKAPLRITTGNFTSGGRYNEINIYSPDKLRDDMDIMMELSLMKIYKRWSTYCTIIMPSQFIN